MPNLRKKVPGRKNVYVKFNHGTPVYGYQFVDPITGKKMLPMRWNSPKTAESWGEDAHRERLAGRDLPPLPAPRSRRGRPLSVVAPGRPLNMASLIDDWYEQWQKRAVPGSTNPPKPASVKHRRSVVKHAKELVGDLDYTNCTRKAVITALYPVRERIGQSRLNDIDWLIREALRYAVEEGYRSSSTAFERPFHLVSTVTSPVRARPRLPNGPIARVLNFLRANPRKFYSVSDVAAGLNNHAGRAKKGTPETPRHLRCTEVQRVLRNLVFAPHTGIIKIPVSLNEAGERKGWAKSLFAYDPDALADIDDPDGPLADEPDDDGDFLDPGYLDPHRSMQIIANMAPSKRLAAALERFEALRRGELWAALVRDFVPGDRERDRRGRLRLFREPKNSYSKATLPLAWAVNDFIVDELNARYGGPKWRTDKSIREHPLVGVDVSYNTFYVSLYEAMWTVDPTLLRDTDGKLRVPHNLRRWLNIDLSRGIAGISANQGTVRTATLRHKLRGGTDGASAVNAEDYMRILWEHRAAGAEGIDNVIEAELGGAISFSEFDRELREKWMTLEETVAVLKSHGADIGPPRKRGQLRDYPLPPSLRDEYKTRIGFLRADVNAFLSTRETPVGSVTTTTAKGIHNTTSQRVSKPARQHPARNAERRPVTGERFLNEELAGGCAGKDANNAESIRRGKRRQHRGGFSAAQIRAAASVVRALGPDLDDDACYLDKLANRVQKVLDDPDSHFRIPTLATDLTVRAGRIAEDLELLSRTRTHLEPSHLEASRECRALQRDARRVASKRAGETLIVINGRDGPRVLSEGGTPTAKSA